MFPFTSRLVVFLRKQKSLMEMRCFRFPIFTAIRELIRCTLERPVEAMFTRTRHWQFAWNNHQVNQSPNIRFVILLISLFVDKTAKFYVTRKRENEFRLNVVTITAAEEFTSKEFKYILRASTQYNPFLTPFPPQSSNLGSAWSSIYSRPTPCRYRRTTLRPQNPALWNIAGSICHVNDKLVTTLNLVLIYTFQGSLHYRIYLFVLNQLERFVISIIIYKEQNFAMNTNSISYNKFHLQI